MPDLEQITKQVQQVVSEVGRFVRHEQDKLSGDQIKAKGRSDFVTEIDKESERRLVEQLAKILPGAGFITEEETVATEERAYNWIIDPIDGTTNFIHGLPPYSISIALWHQDEIIIGVVYEIKADEMFYAWKGSPAYMNNRMLKVTNAASFNEALITTGFPYEQSDYFKGMMDVLTYVINHSHGVRRLGSAATDMCYLAAGRMDVFYEPGLHVWDVAAASLIIRQAGGTVTDFSGGANYLYGKEMLATNTHLHQPFLDMLKQNSQ